MPEDEGYGEKRVYENSKPKKGSGDVKPTKKMTKREAKKKKKKKKGVFSPASMAANLKRRKQQLAEVMAATK